MSENEIKFSDEELNKKIIKILNNGTAKDLLNIVFSMAQISEGVVELKFSQKGFCFTIACEKEEIKKDKK